MIPMLPGVLERARKLPHGEERMRVVAEAWEWLETPWVHECRVKGSGADCGNIVAGIFAATGLIEEPPLFKYAHDFYLHSKAEIFREKIEMFCEPLGLVAPLAGDIVGFRLGRNTPAVCHSALMIDTPLMIHAQRRAGKVQTDDLAGVYLKMWSGTWRLRRWV